VNTQPSPMSSGGVRHSPAPPSRPRAPWGHRRASRRRGHAAVAVHRTLAGVVGREGQDRVAAESPQEPVEVGHAAPDAVPRREAVGDAEPLGRGGHELHEPRRPGRGDRVHAPRAFHRDHRKHQGWRDPGAHRGAQDVRPVEGGDVLEPLEARGGEALGRPGHHVERLGQAAGTRIGQEGGHARPEPLDAGGRRGPAAAAARIGGRRSVPCSRGTEVPRGRRRGGGAAGSICTVMRSVAPRAARPRVGKVKSWAAASGRAEEDGGPTARAPPPPQQGSQEPRAARRRAAAYPRTPPRRRRTAAWICRRPSRSGLRARARPSGSFAVMLPSGSVPRPARRGGPTGPASRIPAREPGPGQPGRPLRANRSTTAGVAPRLSRSIRRAARDPSPMT
jgi:hypothetical protein